MSRRVPHDAALPQLAQALDPQAMAPVFSVALNGRRVQRCQVDRIKYRPGRSCSVSYVLGLRDGPRGRDVEQRITARFCTGGDSARRYAKEAGRAALPSAAGPALLYLPALDMLAHCWPNDARLDAPALLHDADRLRAECLGPVVAALTGGAGHLIDHRTTLVQYVPETRVCARVELRLRTSACAPATTQVLYAKADVGRGGAGTHALMQALYASPAQTGGRLGTPRPLLWQAAAGLHWQLAVPGLALPDVDPQVGPALSARVGAQLAALHATPLPPGGLRKPGPRCLHPRDVAALLGQVNPDWQALLQGIAETLEVGGAALANEPSVTLHGDLHPHNLLVDAERLYFIDMDNAHAGPAVVELGAWVADALYRALLNGSSLRRAAPSWRSFLYAYTQAAGRRIDAALLAWSTAHSLLCQRAYRCVANLKPGRFEIVPALLALADVICRAGTVESASELESGPA